MVKIHKNTIYHNFSGWPHQGLAGIDELMMAALFWQLSVIIVIQGYSDSRLQICQTYDGMNGSVNWIVPPDPQMMSLWTWDPSPRLSW